MKKKIFSTALILSALIGFNASAQNNAPEAPKCDKKEQCKGDRPDAPRAPRFNPFEGITLTAEQQSQIDALCPQREARPEAKECKNDCKADSAKCCKDAKCCKKDKKAGGRDGVKGKRGNRPDKNMKAEYIKKVKEILTPEQYVVFLENLATQPQPAFRPRHHRHEGKGPRHGECPEQGQCPQEVEK